MKTAFVCLTIALLAGCSAPASSRRAAGIAKRESGRLAAPSQPLSSFGQFELKPMELSAAIQENRDKVKVAQEFESKLRARLLPLLEQWQAQEGSPRTGGTLSIQPKLTEFYIAGAGVRFVGGGYVRPTNIEMDLELTDATTRTIIANPHIMRSAGQGASFRSSDRAQMDYAVEIAYQYLVDNYKK